MRIFIKKLAETASFCGKQSHSVSILIPKARNNVDAHALKT